MKETHINSMTIPANAISQRIALAWTMHIVVASIAHRVLPAHKDPLDQEVLPGRKVFPALVVQLDHKGLPVQSGQPDPKGLLVKRVLSDRKGLQEPPALWGRKGLRDYKGLLAHRAPPARPAL